MSYEACDVHPDESATNGCALCKCEKCGSSQLHHDQYACVDRRLAEAYDLIYRMHYDDHWDSEARRWLDRNKDHCW